MVIGMLINELMRGNLKLSHEEIRTVLSHSGLEPTPAAEICPLLVEIPASL